MLPLLLFNRKNKSMTTIHPRCLFSVVCAVILFLSVSAGAINPVSGANVCAHPPDSLSRHDHSGKPGDTVLQVKKKVTFKDTLDHNLDFSDYLINMHGFVPWPVIISEPALGSFGIAMALVFVSPKKSAKGADQFRFPDITGVAGMYTVNNTWGGGAMRQGSVPKIGLRYTVGFGYVDAKMDFYRESKYFGEIKYKFNLKPIVLAVDLSENLWKNKLFAGIRYEFARMRIAYDTPNIPDSIYDKNTFDKNIGNLGIYAEWDSRNTLFTPDKGVRFKASAGLGRSWTGSSFDFERYEAFTNIFIQPVKPWVCGLRVDFQAVGGTIPFYYYPYIDMRGIAMMRYQGQQVLVIETEQRFDITRRWSVLGFVGTGKTFSNQRFMEDKNWHWAGGAGFRYLLARLFRMRMGVDIAAGPDQFAYYIVLGHYWNR